MTISPGHHLYLHPDNRWRCAGPDDRFFRVGGPDPVLERAQRLLHIGDGDPDAPELRAVLDGLGQQGVTAGSPEPAGDPAIRPVVGIDGGGPIAEQLGVLLAGVADVKPVVTDGDSVERVDVLVSCAGWLPDARWRSLGARCERLGTPWHQTHADGDTVVVGPLYVPGRTAGYRDVRGRRLAASAFPDELLGLWAYLDGDQPQPPPPPVDPATAAVVAGLVAADVAGLLRGGTWPSEGHQLVVVPSRAEVRRHRVLPLPAFAPLEGAR